jgi:hypothetical protein
MRRTSRRGEAAEPYRFGPVGREPARSALTPRDGGNAHAPRLG